MDDRRINVGDFPRLLAFGEWKFLNAVSNEPELLKNAHNM